MIYQFPILYRKEVMIAWKYGAWSDVTCGYELLQSCVLSVLSHYNHPYNDYGLCTAIVKDSLGNQTNYILTIAISYHSWRTQITKNVSDSMLATHWFSHTHYSHFRKVLIPVPLYNFYNYFVIWGFRRNTWCVFQAQAIVIIIALHLRLPILITLLLQTFIHGCKAIKCAIFRRMLHYITFISFSIDPYRVQS